MKKGFTLIELMATIGLLAVVMTLIGISVNNINEDSREELKDKKLDYILAGGEKWGYDHINKIKDTCDDMLDDMLCANVCIKDLITENYIIGEDDKALKLSDPLEYESGDYKDLNEEYIVKIIYDRSKNKIKSEIIESNSCKGEVSE